MPSSSEISSAGIAVANIVLANGVYRVDTRFVVGQVRNRGSTLIDRALKTTGGELVVLAVGGAVPATALIAATAAAVNIREAVATDGSGTGVVFGGFATQLGMQLRGLVGDRASVVGTPSIGVVVPDPSPSQRSVVMQAEITVHPGKTITLDDVNRVVARAVANSIAVSLVDGTAMPSDGRPLFDRLMDNGGPVSRVYPSGHTSIIQVAVTSPQSSRAPVVLPVPTSCIVPAPELFYLRSTPTFAVSGTRIGAGTPIEFLNNTGLVQGANRLWQVRVVSSNATGYAVFPDAVAPACNVSDSVEPASGALFALLAASMCATVIYALRRHGRRRE